MLAEPAPVILQNVSFKQNPLSILKLEMVLNYERRSRGSTYKPRLSFQPGHGLEKMIAPDLDIGGRVRGGCSSEQDVLRAGLQIIVHDLDSAG